tara:strand:- start:3214 stop:4173 length:960 start_codon:yes stop_codon:yes gene_type:complete
MSSFIIVGCGKIGHEYSSILNKQGHEIKLAFATGNSDSHVKLAKKYNAEFSSDISIFNKTKFDYDGIIISIPAKEDLKWLNKLPPTNILIEKPGQLKSVDLEELNKGIHNIFIAYNRKFYNSYSHLQRFVKSQTKPCIVNVNIPEPLNPQLEDDNTQRPFNVINNSCHIISILRGVFGKLNLQKTLNVKKLFINGSALLNTITSEGHIVILTINIDEYNNTSIQVKGDKNSLILKPIEESKEIIGLNSEIDLENNVRKYYQVFGETNKSYCNFGFKPGFYNQVEAFTEFCKSRENPINTLTRIEEGIEIIKEIEYFLNK